MRVTWTTMNARIDSAISGSAKPSAEQLVEALVVRAHVLAVPVQAQDPRRAVERAEHHADAAVLAQVGDRLRAAADDVQVGDGVVVEHPKGPDRSLRGDVDVPVVTRWRRAHEEYRLFGDPCLLVVVDAIVDAAHTG